MQTDRILVVGPSGSGKTALVAGNHPATREKSILKRFKEKSKYVFVADPHRYYQNSERFRDAGFFLERLRGDLRSGVYAFSFDNDLDWEVFFDAIQIFVESDSTDCTLIVDELLDISDARSSLESFRWFFSYARHHRCHLAYNSMRPVNVDGLLRANLTEVFAFRQTHDDDVQALAEISFIGERAWELTELKRFEYRHFREMDVFAEEKSEP